jgi:hypothetical protein
VKESPLHYLIGLAQRGMSFGLKTEISEDEIRLVSGLRLLSSVGPRVYQRILVGSDPKALKKYSPPPGPNDLVVLTSSNQQDLVYGGGLVLDAAGAGPGYSHAAVFARGHGMSAIAMPDLAGAVEKFFGKATQSGGYYVDDRPGSFVIKPLGSAIAEGLLKASDVDRLRPGFNLQIDSYDVTTGGEKILVDHRSRTISEDHPERRIELYVPDLSNELGLLGPTPFEALAETPIGLLRQSSGEKGAVLIKLGAHDGLQALGVEVPSGVVISPYLVMQLLKEAKVQGHSLYDHWQAALADPEFQQAKARLGDGETPGMLARLKKTTQASLRALLLDAKQPSPRGKQLLKQISAHPALAGKVPVIARSSFTGEDRPNKSGAGQYSSFPNLFTGEQRLEGIIGVIAATWNEGAIESNLASGIDLKQVWPSVVIQRCIQPTVSGVAISRGEHGGFGEVSYQAKPKFGGGVDGGPAEEGVVASGGASVRRSYGQESGSLLSAKQQDILRRAVLLIEEEFNRSVEPGQHHAVDVEWAFAGDKLHILQARTISGV